mgnify:CR=1 FL=1
MNYTDKQIKNAKRRYNSFLKIETLADHDVETIGLNEANNRIDHHNEVVRKINNGDKKLEQEKKLFFLTDEVKKDQKDAESKAKKDANKAKTADVIEPIRKMKKLGAFGKWLNTPGNPYRKQHFKKYYTQEAVDAYLETL